MLHDAMEKILLEAGQPMKTSDIAERVNARGLYIKRDGSPVLPNQISGRAGKYPHLFTRSGGMVSLVRWDDSPPQEAERAPSPKASVATLARPASSSIETSELELESAILDPEAFRLASDVDLEVPDRPGLYAIRVRDHHSLPEPFRSLSERRGDLIYVGIARRSLSRRFLGQELRARGHGTFFRSIGTVLGYRPLAGSLIGKRNVRNYTFTPEDNHAIIEWINTNLLVNWVTFSGAHALEESALIRKHLPLLNLQGNPARLVELSALRAECVNIANTVSE